MSEKIVTLNEEVIKGQLKELVRGSVEETLNELLEKYTGNGGDVVIPEGVTSIIGGYNRGVFSDHKLTSVTFPESLTSIGECAFSGCGGLVRVTISPNVKSIKRDAFKNCKKLKEVHVDSLEIWLAMDKSEWSDTPLCNGALLYFDDKPIEDLVVPVGVTCIGKKAFAGCRSLKSVTFPESLTSIGDYAFSGCNGLKSVILPENLTSIGDNTFSDCSGLVSVTIPASLKSIGSWTFKNCSSLTSVMIPAGVTDIGYSAFSMCSGLKSLTIPESVTDIGVNACESIGNGTFGMSSLTDIQIPASVRSIGSMAFCGLLKIGAITIPEGVRALGNMVFSGSNSLRTVSLPASLDSVGEDIFYGCESLEKVTMPHVTFDRFKDEAWLKSIESRIEIVPSIESNAGKTVSMATTDENDEDSWIQTIAAETPLQDEEILYLRTIHQLFQSADTVRMIDVAKRLEQGTGKVSYWMKKLREKGILDTTPKGVITMLKPAKSKKDETKEEATEDGSAASVGSVEREDDFVVSADDVDGADDTGEELETPHEATESVQEENGLEPEAQEQPIEEEPDVIPEGPDSRSQRRRERSTEKMLEAIEEIRRRYPEGASEADMKALKQKNPDILWQILAGNAKRVLGKPLVPYLEDIGILRKENADRQVAVEAERENDEQAQREAEERAERESEEKARREAEEQAQREAEEQARREAIEAARQEKIRSIKSQIDDLKAEMNATGGLFGAFKRKKIQAAIDELTDQLNKLE